jgi:hypothetical protein
VRPVHLVAAFQLPSPSSPSGGPGVSSASAATEAAAAAAGICCIMWAGRPRSERQASRCEVYAVRLSAAGAGAALQVQDVQLLKVRPRPC